MRPTITERLVKARGEYWHGVLDGVAGLGIVACALACLYWGLGR